MMASFLRTSDMFPEHPLVGKGPPCTLFWVACQGMAEL